MTPTPSTVSLRYHTFWVNRAGAPVEELDVVPAGQGRNLEDLLKYVQAHNL